MSTGSMKFGIPENFLTCGLCHETYGNPKQLPCLHSFCKLCLASYIEEKSRESGLDNFPCPVCNKATRFRGSVSSDPLEWADDYNDNHFILNLLQTLKLEKADDIDGTPKSHASSKCTEHWNEVLQYYCYTCHMVLCKTCKTTNHENCHVDNFGNDNIHTMCKLLQDEAKSTITEVKGNAGDLCQTLIPKQRDLIMSKEEIAFEITRYYSEIRNRINQVLMRQEQALQTELDDIVEKRKESLSENVGWCKSVMRTLENDDQLLRSLRSEGSGTDIGVMKVLQEINVQLSQYKKAIQKMVNEADDRLNVHFTVYGEAEDTFLTPKLGIVEISAGRSSEHRPNKFDGFSKTGRTESPLYGPQTAMVGNCSSKIKAHLNISFPSKIADDQSSNNIVGLTWVGDRLLAIDRWNHKIKLFADNGTALSSAVFEEGEPWDVTFMGHSDVSDKSFCYVTLPKARLIHSVTITKSGAMNFEYEFSVAKGYTCLAYNKAANNIVCGSSAPFAHACVELIDLNGGVLASFAMDVTGHPLFSYPRSIEISESGTIVVCDWNRNAVIFLRSDGFIIGTYDGTPEYPLKDPVGISLVDNRNVFVSDTKSNNLFVISMTGELAGVLEVGDAFTQPKDIAAILHETGTIKLAAVSKSSTIQVFRINSSDIK